MKWQAQDLGHMAHNAVKKVLLLIKYVVKLKISINQIIEIMYLIEAYMT